MGCTPRPWRRAPEAVGTEPGRHPSAAQPAWASRAFLCLAPGGSRRFGTGLCFVLNRLRGQGALTPSDEGKRPASGSRRSNGTGVGYLHPGRKKKTKQLTLLYAYGTLRTGGKLLLEMESFG